MPIFSRSDPRTSLPEGEFDSLFAEHWERIYQVLYHLTGDPAETEDLALEVFTRLWQQPPATRTNLGGWLYRVACNLGYNALRAGRRRQQYELQAGRDALDLPTSTDPERECEARLERRKVRQVLRRLGPRQSRLLILRHAGLSYREIAAALGLNPASVGSLLLRAEQQFERLYDQGEEP